MKILDENTIIELMIELGCNEQETIRIRDTELKRCLSFVSFLENSEASIINKLNFLKREDIFYNLYYWQNRFKKRHFELFGYDEGLEQQSFKMLEAFELQFPGTLDWSLVEQIENDSEERGCE